MRKRERENPCRVCGNYHKYEEGEICGVCGHRMPASIEKLVHQESAFPSEILKDFLYLGSYDNASRSEVLKTLGISHILNMINVQKIRAHVLVHCMTGKSRSPAIVIAYLMKCKGWHLTQSFQWVKERRTQVELSSGAQQQLLEFEHRLFGSNEAVQAQNLVQSDPRPTFAFGISKPIDTPPHFPFLASLVRYQFLMERGQMPCQITSFLELGGPKRSSDYKGWFFDWSQGQFELKHTS